MKTQNDFFTNVEAATCAMLSLPIHTSGAGEVWNHEAKWPGNRTDELVHALEYLDLQILSNKFIEIIDTHLSSYEISMYVVRFPNAVPTTQNSLYSLADFTNKGWDYVGIVPLHSSEVGFDLYKAADNFDITNFKKDSNYIKVSKVNSPEVNTLYLTEKMDSFIKFHSIEGDKDPKAGKGDAFFIIRLKK